MLQETRDLDHDPRQQRQGLPGLGEDAHDLRYHPDHQCSHDQQGHRGNQGGIDQRLLGLAAQRTGLLEVVCELEHDLHQFA
ncbi:hypothetical protein RZS08_29755, partial [Arthrospira platensis SPKY1]|nr:hypothetical protein [Arthrospira platensis SPKY1]